MCNMVWWVCENLKGLIVITIEIGLSNRSYHVDMWYVLN